MNLSVLRGPGGRSRLEWIGAAALLLAVGAALVLAAYRDRAGIEARENERLQGQARVIDENTIRQLIGVSQALEGMRGRLGRREPVVDAAVTEELELLVGAMPGVSTMLILDASGQVVASSRPEFRGRNFRQRDYFAVPRRHPDVATLYLSPPFLTALGTFVVVATKVLVDEHGQFAGVVTATLDPDYFDVVLRSVLYAADMRTTLMHGNGRVFLDTSVGAGVGKKAPAVRLAAADTSFAALRGSAQPAALVTGTVFEGEAERMVALRRIARADLHMDEPLVVAASRETAALYLPWRERTFAIAVLYALLGAAAALGLSFVQRRRLAVAEVAAAIAHERQLATERVEQALRGADLGLWDLHVPSNALVVNERERALLGFGADDTLPANQGWRDLIHPEDRAAAEASILPHLRGEAASFESEYRMRHRDGHWVWLFSRAMIVERDAAGAPLRIVGTHLDVTARRLADAELSRVAARLGDSEEQLRQVTDNMPALVCRLDTGQRFCFANRAFRDWLHLEPEALLGHSLGEVFGEAAYATFSQHVETALAGERVVYTRVLETPGGQRQVEAILVPQFGADGEVLGLYGLMNDITARHQAEERLRHLAEFDTLTGLPNRFLFQDRLRQGMRRAARGQPMALLFLDIDHFKSVNDSLGHEAGDQLLKVYAARMQAAVRESDTVARLAGDEFTIVLEGLRDRTDATMLAGKLVQALAQPMALAGRLLTVTASIGVAFCTPGESDDAALLRRADAALYEAKRRGRNGFFCDDTEAPGALVA